MEDGAILIGDNILNDDDFIAIETTSTFDSWTGEEHLLEPQLQPAAEYPVGENSIEVRRQAGSSAGPGCNAFALLGTTVGSDLGSGYSGPFGFAVTAEYYDGSAWQHVDGYSVYELFAPGSPTSVVVIFDEYILAQRYRVRFSAATGGHVGSVLVGRTISDITLSDRGWRQRYRDEAKQVRSEDNQVYCSSPSIVREMTIPANSVDLAATYGVHRIVNSVSLPAPVLGKDTSESDGWYSVGPGHLGSIDFKGPLTVGKYYRLDYEQRQDYVPDFLTSHRPRWRVATGSLDIGSNQGWSTSRASVYGQAVSDDLLWTAPSESGTSELRILGLYEIDYQPDGGQGFRSHLANLQAVMARHGHSRPVIAMIRPSDPVMNRVSGIYGYLAADNELTQRADADGDLFSTTLRITEAR